MAEPDNLAVALLELRRAQMRIAELESQVKTAKCDECGCVVRETVKVICDRCVEDVVGPLDAG